MIYISNSLHPNYARLLRLKKPRRPWTPHCGDFAPISLPVANWRCQQRCTGSGRQVEPSGKPYWTPSSKLVAIRLLYIGFLLWRCCLCFLANAYTVIHIKIFLGGGFMLAGCFQETGGAPAEEIQKKQDPCREGFLLEGSDENQIGLV